MKQAATHTLRNVLLASHGGTGKTSLLEAVLFALKLTDRKGAVEQGNTVSDYEPEEIKKKISLNLSLAPALYKDTKINFLDAPGFTDFIGEVVSGLYAAESVLILLSATAGVEVGTEKIFKLAQKEGLACVFVVNKLDRENANFEKCLDSIREKLKAEPLQLQLPVGSEASLSGVYDVLSGKVWKGDTQEDAPAELAEKGAALLEKVKEAAAEGDDELTAKYLEEENLTKEEIEKGLRGVIAQNKVYPVLCASAAKDVGLHALLEFIVNFLPSPDAVERKRGKYKMAETEPLSALVFKTQADPFVGRINFVKVLSGILKPDSQVYNAAKEKMERLTSLFTMKGKTQVNVPQAVAGDICVLTKLSDTSTNDTLCEKDKPVQCGKIAFPKPIFSMAVEPKSKGDEEKMSTSLHKLTEEDATFTVVRDPVIKQAVVSGLGEQHLDVIVERAHRKFGVGMTMVPMKIPYKEAIRKKAQAQGKHKKQSGGRGQYGDVWLEVEPRKRGEGFVFDERVFGGSVPRNYFPSVEKGVKESLNHGILAGFPVVDIKVTLYDGSYHEVDSSDIAFQIAAQMGFKNAVQLANPVILEPVMNVEITVPQDFMGDIIGDLNSKRGRVLGTEQMGDETVVKATAPLVEMQKYAVDLKSMTQGRGSFAMELASYEEVPAFLAEKIIATAKKEKEEAKK